MKTRMFDKANTNNTKLRNGKNWKRSWLLFIRNV